MAAVRTQVGPLEVSAHGAFMPLDWGRWCGPLVCKMRAGRLAWQIRLHQWLLVVSALDLAAYNGLCKCPKPEGEE